jgi:single-strand DNA-binding protein
MLNTITIAGRLTRDPEVKITEKGVTLCDFSVAVERDFKNGGEKVTDFFDCTAWRAPAEFLVKYIRKGAMLVVKGRMQCQNWIDKEGQKRRKWYIECDNVYPMESRKDRETSTGATTDYSMPSNPQPEYSQAAFQVLIDCDEQLPF